MIRCILLSIQKKQQFSHFTTIIKKTEFDCEDEKWTSQHGSEVNEVIKPTEENKQSKRAHINYKYTS